MYAVLLNPPKKRRKRRRRSKLRYKGGKYVKRRRRRRKKMTVKARRARRKRGTARARRTRARRSCARKVRSAVDAVVCGPRKRYSRLRRRCRTAKRKRAASARHGGIAGMIEAKRAPAVISRNPRRRRRSRRRNYSHFIPAYKNPRRRRSRRRRRNYSHFIPAYKNPSWVPSYAMNPGRGVVGALTAGFKPDPLMKTLPVVGGALGNAMFSGFVSGYMPGVLQAGPGSLILGLGTAGLLGAASAVVVSPKYAQGVFLGGVIEVVTRGVREYLLPVIPGLSGVGYLTRRQGETATAIGGYADSMETGAYLPSFAQATGLNRDGTPSYAQASGLNPYKYGMQGLGDYLSRRNVAEARPLGAMLYNDVPIEGAMREELAFGF